MSENISNLYYEKISDTHVGVQCTFIEGNTSHLQLFTAVDLSSLSHRVPRFTPCARAPVLNIRIYEKIFRWRKIYIVEQYSSNKFLDECGSKIFPLRKKLITVYHYAGHEAVQGWCRNIELKK